jgi:hypothetical protein
MRRGKKFIANRKGDALAKRVHEAVRREVEGDEVEVVVVVFQGRGSPLVDGRRRGNLIVAAPTTEDEYARWLLEEGARSIS